MDLTVVLNTDVFLFGIGFLFIFAIIYGLLGVAKLFDNKVNALLGIVLALFGAAYMPLISFLFVFMPIAIAILVIVFLIVLLKKLFQKDGERTDLLPVMVSLGILLLLLGIFWGQLRTGMTAMASDNLLWAIGIIVIIILFWAAYAAGGNRSRESSNVEHH